MKLCGCCKQLKSLEDYHRNIKHSSGYERLCKSCRKVYSANRYKKNWFHQTYLLKKSWCKSKGIPFDLDREYLESIWTDTCPITGRVFVKGNKQSPDCPSLDRKIPEKGYIKGNVCFISARMNRLKDNASVQELEAVIRYIKENY